MIAPRLEYNGASFVTMSVTLEPGTTVGHYQILGRLGAGGMGEVYRAQDAVLGRTLALKILPPHLVRNEERMRRFVQEARSASSLNHPNIVTIYEIGSAPLVLPDGRPSPTSEPIHYIAMELVDGVTLKTRIHDERTPLRTLVTNLAQAADGLAKAHAAGIIHRDLKPENIMVSSDGFTKVLDFGLAKLSPRQDPADSQTRTLRPADDTRDGVLLGTVAYMSPEQVQGKPADHRSDIFAMGAILYEAATRRRPFTGDSDVEVMHRILHEKPESIDALNPAVPTELRRTIRRCLAKEPERRFQSMKDLAIELAEIAEEFDELSLSSASGSGSVPGQRTATRRLDSRWVALLVLAAAATVGLAAFGVSRWTRGAGDRASPVTYESMRMTPLTSTGRAHRAAISPDGKYVAHVQRDARGQFSLWMRQVATGSDVKIVPEQPNALQWLAFSPDGDYVYYTSADEPSGNVFYSWLYVIPALGGQPRRVIFDVDTPVAFSPDGTQIAFGRGVPGERRNHLIVAGADGGGERVLASFQRFVDAGQPAWSPDGSSIVVSTADVERGWDVALMEVDVASGASRRVGTTRRFEVNTPHFLPDGSAIVLAAADAETARTQIWLQPYPDGTPVRVTNDLSNYRALSMTHDGSQMAALKAETTTSLVRATTDATSLGAPFAATRHQLIEDVAVADTGAIVYGFTQGNRADIAVLDRPDAAPRVLTHEGENFNPSITADGRLIVFQRESAGPPRIYAMDADGSNLRPLTSGEGETQPRISRDGSLLVHLADYERQVWVQRIDGSGRRKLTDRANGPATISPDGRHVAFLEWETAERATARLRILAVAEGPPLLEMPWRTGFELRWTRDGEALTFRRLMGRVANIFRLPVRGGEPSQITRFESGTFGSYDWAPDGSLVLVRTETTSDVVLITDWLRQPGTRAR